MLGIMARAASARSTVGRLTPAATASSAWLRIPASRRAAAI
jgi:hypothetical protein